ncbi:MAG: ABC transporter ATP-binding protein [Granulosicoccus sp.]|nr:ABC transporter ATP-binding protein [Granulosicoccus sp.]
MIQTAVEFAAVSRHFGDIRAVDEVDLRIAEGEFFAMLGPSGSGKTTCLRLIAGFEQPTAGQIHIFSRAMAGVPPYRRQVNTVFQDYALFPHLSVSDNIAYGLMIRGQGRSMRRRAAEEALELVRLPGYADRKPGELSGGQRQRVALARALVNQPKVLLLDEPLGALDLKLREQMQDELRSLQKSLGITFVFVTHDQGEALSMADRVAVFDAGKIIQVGTPQEVYHRPRNAFVADFVGSSNVLPAHLTESFTGQSCPASLRPECIRFVDTGGCLVTVASVSFLGSATRYTVLLDGTPLTVLSDNAQVAAQPGREVRIDWDNERLHCMSEGHE